MVSGFGSESLRSQLQNHLLTSKDILKKKTPCSDGTHTLFHNSRYTLTPWNFYTNPKMEENLSSTPPKQFGAFRIIWAKHFINQKPLTNQHPTLILMILGFSEVYHFEGLFFFLEAQSGKRFRPSPQKIWQLEWLKHISKRLRLL